MWKLALLSCLIWYEVSCIIPPRFQWKTLDFAWESPEQREQAVSSESYIPQNNMPTGIARWKDKIFITIPRWKKVVLSITLLEKQHHHTPVPRLWRHALEQDGIKEPLKDFQYPLAFRQYSSARFQKLSLCCDSVLALRLVDFKLFEGNPNLVQADVRDVFGVPSSLNYILINGAQNQSLIPYPTWEDAYCKEDTCCLASNSTVISTFRVNVDSCDRLWVVDNGAADMAGDVKQITEPAIMVFDLKTDKLINRYPIAPEVLMDSSVLTSIVVDVVNNNCEDTFAYIPDMGSNAIIVFNQKTGEIWRVENHYFHFDPHAGTYKVGGVDFYWSDGVSALALSNPKKDGYRDVFLYPTSSTRQFKMSSKLLRDKEITKEQLFNGVDVIGDRGPNTQSTACDFDPTNEVLFYTQLCKNGLACWQVDKPFDKNNTPLLVSDCQMLEFPNDVKVDNEGNIWILSDRQSRFLYESMDFDQVNFRVLSAPTALMIQGTACEKSLGTLGRVMNRIKRMSK